MPNHYYPIDIYYTLLCANVFSAPRLTHTFCLTFILIKLCALDKHLIKICNTKNYSLKKLYDEAMRNKKWHAVGKIDIPRTEMHDLPLSLLGRGTVIKSDSVKLVLMFCLS